LHGGYLMAVADSVGAMLTGFNLPEGAITATIESPRDPGRDPTRLSQTASPV
jgi:hypothetical protein